MILVLLFQLIYKQPKIHGHIFWLLAIFIPSIADPICRYYEHVNFALASKNT
jgi:hypothetical protein